MDADGHRHVSLVSPRRLLGVVVVCFVYAWAGARSWVVSLVCVFVRRNFLKEGGPGGFAWLLV